MIRISYRRQVPTARKLEVVAKVINGLGLTWTDVVVGQCFNAVDSAIGDYVSRIHKYFLAEGMLYLVEPSSNVIQVYGNPCRTRM
jgi:hypothetical protein